MPVCVISKKFGVWQYQNTLKEMISCFTKIIVLTFCTFCILLTYFNFIMISKIGPRRVQSTSMVLKNIHNNSNVTATEHKNPTEVAVPRIQKTPAKIPAHIHQFWEGSNRPDKLMQSCRQLHPHWQYTLWNVSTVRLMPTLHNKAIFEDFVKRKKGPGMADIARYSILREYGGIYLDADTLCFRSFEPLLQYGFFAGYHSKENTGTHENNKNHANREMLANGIMGSQAQHPVIVKVTDELENRIRDGPAWATVGPKHLTHVLQTCPTCNRSGDVLILPFYAFVPYHHHEKNIFQKTLNFHELSKLPKVKKFGSFAMNLWGSTFNHWKQLKSININPLLGKSYTHKKIIYFLHLHKAGGSTMCEWARQNYQIVPKGNCAIDARQACCGGESIEAQQKFALQTKYTFIANEDYMFSQMDMKYYDYVVTMRNSFSRYASHYRHILRDYGMKKDFQTWMRGQPDNWITRHLCGTLCQNRPKYALTLQDTMLAYNRLRNFSDILFLESWRQNAVSFATKRKWNSGMEIHSNQAKQPQENQFLHLSVMTSLDDIIYQQAFEKFTQRHEHVERKVLHELNQIHKMNFTFTSPCGEKCTEY